MTFDHIAINDGCMAGLQFCWNMVFLFDLVQSGQVLSLDRESISFQILSPIATASSSRQFIYGHKSAIINLLANAWRASGQDIPSQKHE